MKGETPVFSVCVIDIGSPSNLGWAMVSEKNRLKTIKCNNLDMAIETIVERLPGEAIALGFECPLFVPVRENWRDLTKARKGECSFGINRPWSAGAGATSLAIGLPIVTYTLRKIREGFPRGRVFVDWKRFVQAPGNLLLFEAFVSGRSKGKTHMHDAILAARKMSRFLASGKFESAIHEDKIISLLGSALLRTGWTQDLEVLNQPCLVVRPSG